MRSSLQEQYFLKLDRYGGLDSDTLNAQCEWINIYAADLNVDTDQLSSDIFGRFGRIDLSRIPPKVTLGDVRSRDALRTEINGILQSNEKGVPIGGIIALGSKGISQTQRLHITVVTKIKQGKGFKCRLCVRGDQQSNAKITFSSAPTVGRYVRALAFLMANEKEFTMRMTDVSQAFTQSDLYNVEDRVLIMVPDFVLMTSSARNGEMIIGKEKLLVEDSAHKRTMLKTKAVSTHGI